MTRWCIWHEKEGAVRNEGFRWCTEKDGTLGAMWPTREAAEAYVDALCERHTDEFRAQFSIRKVTIE